MRLLLVSALWQTALANPLTPALFERQLSPSQSICSVSYTKSCTGTLSASASSFCGSLGFGTTVSTSTSTHIVSKYDTSQTYWSYADSGRRTTISTTTSYTRTSTITAATVTSINNVTKTSTVTQLKTVYNGTSTTTTVIISATGTVTSCAGTAPSLATSAPSSSTPSSPAASSIPSITSQTSSTSTSTSTSTTSATQAGSSASSGTSSPSVSWGNQVPPAATDVPNIDYNGFTSCPQSNDTQVNFNTANMTIGQYNYPYESSYRILCGGKLTSAYYGAYSTQPDVQSCIGQCMAAQGYGANFDNCPGVVFVASGTGAQRCYYQPYAGQSGGNYNLVGFQSTLGQDPGISGLDSSSYLISGIFYANGVPAKRDLGAVEKTNGLQERAIKAPVIEKRQAPPTKPACLKAGNAAQTTSACNCVIPSSTFTRVATATASTTSLRTITQTQKLVATVTSTPTQLITSTVSTVLATRTRTITTQTSVAATTTSTVSWVLAPSATPSQFYVVDDSGYYAEWPADINDNGLYYRVQYDTVDQLDGYDPTVFYLDAASNSLLVANFIDDGGNPETLYIMGQNETTSYGVVAMTIDQTYAQPDGPYPVAACSLTANAQGQCPLLCNVGWYDVNSRDSNGLWSLLLYGSAASQFTNYAVPVPSDG